MRADLFVGADEIDERAPFFNQVPRRLGEIGRRRRQIHTGLVDAAAFERARKRIEHRREILEARNSFAKPRADIEARLLEARKCRAQRRGLGFESFRERPHVRVAQRIDGRRRRAFKSECEHAGSRQDWGKRARPS